MLCIAENIAQNDLPVTAHPDNTRSIDSRLPNELAIVSLMPELDYGLTLKESTQVHLALPQSSAREVLITLQDEMGDYYRTGYVPIETNKANNIASFIYPTPSLPYRLTSTINGLSR